MCFSRRVTSGDRVGVVMRHWAAIGCLVFTLLNLAVPVSLLGVLGTPRGVYMRCMLALPSVWVKQSLHSVGGIPR